MSGRRLTAAQRAAVADALHANTLADEPRSRAAIAREQGVAPSTVAVIAAELGIADPFDTTRTRKATESARDRLKAQRARVSQTFIDKSEKLLAQIDEPHLVFAFGGKENDYNEHLLDAPPTGDIKNLMTSAAIAFDKHLAADKHDAADNHQDTAGVLAQLADELAAAARPPATPTEEAS